MRLVGFDPGKTGGVAWLDLNARTLAVAALPICYRTVSDKPRAFIDEDKLYALLRANPADEAWIEDVWASDQMGVVSIFSFGEGKGILKGCCAGAGIPRRYVPPATWKGDMRISADKDIAKRQSWRLFPRCAKILASSGKAEAALIGLYGALFHSTPIHNIASLQPIKPTQP